MAKIVVKSAKFGIVVKELDTTSYRDQTVLIQDLLQAIPDADWFEGRMVTTIPEALLDGDEPDIPLPEPPEPSHGRPSRGRLSRIFSRGPGR